MILDLFLYQALLLLSLLIVFLSQKGYLGVKSKNFLTYTGIREYIVLLVTISVIILLMLSLLSIILTFIFNIKIDLIYMNNQTNNNNTEDPVRWWPSGTTQNWGIIGTALAVYRMVPGTPRIKAVTAMASLGVTIPSTVYFHAVENPNGFNRLMFSWIKYRETGSCPTNVPNQISDQVLDSVIPKMVEEGQAKYDSISKTTTSFLPDDLPNLFNNIIPESVSSFFLNLFRPVPVQGYLDDLIGQQLFIQILLLMVVVSLIIFLSVYLFIQIMINNKEFITKKFNNKFILFYIKYQVILAKISSFILPLFIMFGLIELFVGLYFLNTHPIPYEKIGIDLHIYLNSQNK